MSCRTRTSAPLLLKKSFEKEIEPQIRSYYKIFDKTMATIQKRLDDKVKAKYKWKHKRRLMVSSDSDDEDESPKAVVFNTDEARLWYSERPHRTFARKATKRVVITTIGGLNEKAAMTIVIGATSEGVLYPVVAILGGKTGSMNNNLPKNDPINKEIEHKVKVGNEWKPS